MSGLNPLPAGELRVGLIALAAVRRDGDVVITTMTPARDWMAIGSHPLDFVLVPSAMGQATSFGLGLALAQPDRRVIVCNGDGYMLMNLGSLITISAAGPTNLVVIVFDNGAYEATGGQPTPGSARGRPDGRRVDFAAIGRASGYPVVFQFDDVTAWAEAAARVLTAPGPVLAIVRVASIPRAPGPRSPGPAGERAFRFMEALNTIAPTSLAPAGPGPG